MKKFVIVFQFVVFLIREGQPALIELNKLLQKAKEELRKKKLNP